MKTYITYILQQNPSYRFTAKGEIFAPIDGDLWQNILSPDQHQTFEENELFDLSSINTLNDWELTGARLGNQRDSTGVSLDNKWKVTGNSLDNNRNMNGRLLDINKKLYRVRLVSNQLPEGHSKNLIKDIESLFLMLQKSNKTATLLKSLEDLKQAQTLAFADDITELSYYRNLFSNRLVRQRTMKRTNTRLESDKKERRQAKVYMIAAAIIVFLFISLTVAIKLSRSDPDDAHTYSTALTEIEIIKELTDKEKENLILEFEQTERVEVFEWRHSKIIEALENINDAEKAKQIIRDEYFKKY